VDHYNRRLDKGLARTPDHVSQRLHHELPFGKGKHWNLTGAADKIFGGWGIAGFLEYGSGTPYSVAPGFSPIPGGAGNRVWINSYENWRGAVSGDKFDPFKDLWWDKTQFQVGPDGKPLTQAQLFSGIGNASKNSPLERRPWFLNENRPFRKLQFHRAGAIHAALRSFQRLQPGTLGRSGVDLHIGEFRICSHSG
jgi:hypothetical protein